MLAPSSAQLWVQPAVLGSGPARGQGRRCYQAAQLPPRWPLLNRAVGSAAGRGKCRQDVLSCGQQVLSHEPLLTSLATWRVPHLPPRPVPAGGAPTPGLARVGSACGPAAKPQPQRDADPHLPLPDSRLGPDRKTQIPEEASV